MQSRVSMVKLTLALALGLAIAAGGWRAVAAFQFNPQPDPPGAWFSAPVTLTRGDLARVNVAYVGDPTQFKLPPGPCRYMIEFYDADGGLLQQTVGELVMGGSQAVLWDPPDWERPTQLVRARVRVLSRTFGGGITATMEVASQATMSSRFAAPGTWVGFNPQPEPPGDRTLR